MLVAKGFPSKSLCCNAFPFLPVGTEPARSKRRYTARPLWLMGHDEGRDDDAPVEFIGEWRVSRLNIIDTIPAADGVSGNRRLQPGRGYRP